MRIIDPTFGHTAAAAAQGSSDGFDLSSDAIVMFSNSKPNAPELLDGIRTRLNKRFGRDDVAFTAKDTASLPAPAGLIGEVADNFRVAVLALGDCGSCSSYCFQDSVELEKRGVATFVIVTTVFEKLVQAHARAAGVEPRLIVLDHPVAGLRPEDLEARIEQATQILLESSPLATA